MALVLPASVYTAGHGYAWSTRPAGIDEDLMEDLLSDARALRPDFPDDDAVTAGLVVRNGTVAAFTVRRAPGWDSVGRDADYSAFAFLPCEQASAVDFCVLLADAFFASPTHTPPESLTYDGPASVDFPVDAPGRLLCHNRLEGLDPHAAGSLIARYGAKADRWTFLATGGGHGVTRPTGDPAHTTFTVTTSDWHR